MGSTIVAVAKFIRKIPVKLASRFVLAMCPLGVLHAQNLAPRAYVITPLHANAITLTWSFYDPRCSIFRPAS